jgi:hypothetical protein
MSAASDTPGAEPERSEPEDRFYRAFHVNPAGMVISRIADGKVLEVNEAYCPMTSCSAAGSTVPGGPPLRVNEAYCPMTSCSPFASRVPGVRPVARGAREGNGRPGRGT